MSRVAVIPVRQPMVPTRGAAEVFDYSEQSLAFASMLARSSRLGGIACPLAVRALVGGGPCPTPLRSGRNGWYFRAHRARSESLSLEIGGPVLTSLAPFSESKRQRRRPCRTEQDSELLGQE